MGRLLVAFLVALSLLALFVYVYLLILRMGKSPLPFVTPLGVIPFADNRVTRVKLSNGYVSLDSKHPRFSKDYHVSLSTERIEEFVNSFVNRVLPETGYAILEWAEISGDGKQTDHVYGTRFTEIKKLVIGLKPYMFRLINDGFVGFGYAWGDQSSLEEIFVAPKKIIRIMTSKDVTVDDLLRQACIPRFKKPQFIADYQTVNGDLSSFATLFPDTHSQFVSSEFLSGVYIPEIVKALDFHEDLVARTDSIGIVMVPRTWPDAEAERGVLH